MNIEGGSSGSNKIQPPVKLRNSKDVQSVA